MAASTGESILAGFSRPTLGVAAIAGAHLVALGVFSATPPLSTVLVLEAVVLVALMGLTLGTGDNRRTLTVTAVLFVVATAGTWAIVRTGTSVLVTALALVTTLSLVGYGLHRFELVALGLVEVDDE